ncbi:MAG: hypothetical protein AAGI25_19860, partial [Bacteroidota bacterium]
NLKIKTPYEEVAQSLSKSAMDQVDEGADLFRIGTFGKSNTVEAQFWSLENPASITNIDDFAKKYGIPAENLREGKFFVQQGQIKPGANFVTREAPGIGSNTGGAIEVVTDPNSVKIETFNMLDFN